MMNTGFEKATRVENFGRNLLFRVDRYFRPDSDDAVCAILDDCRVGGVRATGARHSWSEAVTTHHSMVDLAHLNSIRIEEGADGQVVSAGAGCKVNDILEELRQSGKSLPAFGIIGKQTIAGAVSTATHGSGRSSMSDMVLGARVATYKKDGSAHADDVKPGDIALEATRCGVGCMGILLQLTLKCVDRQLVSEEVRTADTLDEVLDWEKSHPLQQFYLVPFVWKWHAHLRKESDAARSSTVRRKWYYLKRFLQIALFFNLLVKLLANVPGLERLFPHFYAFMYKRMGGASKGIVDYADRLLLMRDDLFRHTEMELFITPDRLQEAVRFIEGVLRYCAGEMPENFGAISQIAACHGDAKVLAGLKDRYVHHYPITFRKVLKDDTMISMTSGGDRYAVSFISYRRNIESFESVMGLLAPIMARAFDARPHWGKLIPLGSADIERLYPRLPEFRGFCEARDPQGVFRNRFANRKLWPQAAS